MKCACDKVCCCRLIVKSLHFSSNQRENERKGKETEREEEAQNNEWDQEREWRDQIIAERYVQAA